MGERTRQGYPIPADRNPNGLPENLIFPWDSAATVVSAAQSVGNSAVEALVDKIRAMIGNPVETEAVATAWRRAARQIVSAIDASEGPGLESAKAELEARWVGTGGDAAITWIGQVVTNGNETSAILLAMASELDGMRSQSITAYKEAIGHIATTAKLILDTAGGVISKIKKGFDITVITDALSDFVELASAVANSLITHMDAMKTRIESLTNQAIALKVAPLAAPAMADYNDNGGWQPRNPTGSKIGTPR
ncbi:hypothetical protein ACFVMC_24360 [Nocardia sp. NPDC127579]|uniref:hypothetical protein n=1 Tax=Nocardia sp. NPDC127579 TaxID=3345402 RepID=UPI003632D69E